ncbi:N-acetylmuramoyl-L-alanine amidase [uncultured Clostridium sp.]|uniref:N-acetylmuramoyl-L-alanine amidase n=1 Tax=uncultured Clostridium sp. TaxID=59620 RepID=UPI002620B10A|nr:N-acetylmuramoyl-L-alanine amidase [uncultured Clostridium sp.]
MKIAIRAGHTFSVLGARGILDETTENRKVKDAVVKYLKLTNHSVLDVTPNDSYNTVSKEISYGVSKANEWGADIFLSIHFNKAYTSYNGVLGTEVLVYNGNATNKEAKEVLKSITDLGFKNRGIKERKDLGELRLTDMKSMIVEICFIEAVKDVELYKNIGFDKIGRQIAEALVGKIEAEKPVKPVIPETIKPKENWIIDLQKELNKNYNGNLIVDGIAGVKTLKVCPVMKSGNKGNLVKILQNRLIKLGFSCGSSGTDGAFGQGTKKAVIEYQKANKLEADGVIGNLTWKKLLNL